MPQQDDGMEKRRQKREAQRKRRQAQVLRMRLTLMLVVVLLAACGFGIYKLTKNAGGEDSPSVQQTVPATEETRETTPIQKSPITTIHIKAAGDLNVTDAVVNAGMAVNSYDFSPVFKDVAAILSDADLTVMNFEGNICGAPYGTETTSAPAELLTALRGCGVDLLQMANSCAINNGLNGLTATLRAIRAAGIEPVGAYSTNEEFRRNKGYTICEVNGIKIAFVAFTKGVGSLGLPAGSENCVNLLYKDYYTTYKDIDTEAITAVLKAAASEKPDLTIALLHWGSEYNETIYDSQEKIVSLLQKNGVNAIIGSHPHLVQKIDYDEVTGNLVAYSLGDFFGDAKRGGTSYSIILDLEITKDYESGTTKITDYSYTPIYTLAEDECDGSRRVVRIENAMSAYELNFVDKVTDSAYENMKFAMERIPERINPPKDKK